MSHGSTRKQTSGMTSTLGCPQLVLGSEKGEDNTKSVQVEKRSWELSRSSKGHRLGRRGYAEEKQERAKRGKGTNKS